MIRKTLLISAAFVALSGCDNGIIPFGNGGGTTADARSAAARQFRTALAIAPRHGLTADMFFKGDVAGGGEAELRPAVQALAAALARGKADPAKTSEVFTLPRSKVDPNAGFEQAVLENRLTEYLEGLAPQTDEYRKLSQAFVHYAALAARTPDTNIPPGDPIKPGSKDPRVPAVIAALRSGGYITPAQAPEQAAAQPAAPAEYTAEVAAAVKRMQADFGLKADGVIGNSTLKAVNTSAKDRARQLAVALERLRWIDREAPATRIDVNTAAAFLTYWRDGRLADERVVVVGEPDWETPELGSPMFQLVANPTWTVPDSIVEDEISKKSGGWLRANNFTQKNGRWVQQPGPKNSLGEVKFDMKNGEAIYLHDTPAKALFATDDRHRSHGCVRVHDAIGFARLLAEADGVLEAFDKALATGEETFVDLRTEIPVRLLYRTAFVGTDGKLRFVTDSYGWDNNVAAALGYERRQLKRRDHGGADVGP